MNSGQNGLSPDATLSCILHQDGLMWSRIQTMQVVQLAGLAAAYAVHTKPWLSFLIVSITALITLLVFGLLRRDWLILIKFSHGFPELDWSVPRKWYAPLTGRETTWALLTILIAADALMGFAIANDWLL